MGQEEAGKPVGRLSQGLGQRQWCSEQKAVVVGPARALIMWGTQSLCPQVAGA